jgi:hypothetical protein
MNGVSVKIETVFYATKGRTEVAMKRNNRVLILITILTCVLILFACKNISLNTYDAAKDTKSTTENGQDSGQTKEGNGQEALSTDAGQSGTEKSGTDNGSPDAKKAGSDQEEGEEDPTPTLIQPTANTELTIFTVNSDAEVKPATALIPVGTEITPQLIVDTVKEALAENSLMVGIESVTTKEDAVIVSFYSDQPPLADVGAGYEGAILDAIAQSLTDNLDDYNKVIYRVEGKAYVSGHVELGIDEVYLSD